MVSWVIGIVAGAIRPFDLIDRNCRHGGFHDGFVIEPRQAEEFRQDIQSFNGSDSNVTPPSCTLNDESWIEAVFLAILGCSRGYVVGRVVW